MEKNIKAPLILFALFILTNIFTVRQIVALENKTIHYCKDMKCKSEERIGIEIEFDGCSIHTIKDLNTKLRNIDSKNPLWNCGLVKGENDSNDSFKEKITDCALKQYIEISNSFNNIQTEACDRRWYMEKNNNGELYEISSTDALVARNRFLALVQTKNIEQIGSVDEVLIKTTPIPAILPGALNKYNYDITILGVKGNNCWIKPDIIPDDLGIANIIPNLLNLRTEVNNFISPLVSKFENPLITILARMQGGRLCLENDLEAAFYSSGKLIADDDEVVPILQSIGEGWYNGKWEKYDKYSNITCKCVGTDEVVEESINTGTQSNNENNFVQGISTVYADSSDTNVLYKSQCDRSSSEKGRKLCIENFCNKINEDAKIPSSAKTAEYNRCVACLTKNKSYYTGIPSKDDGWDGCFEQNENGLCKPLLKTGSYDEGVACRICVEREGGIWTAIGCVYSDFQKEINDHLLPLFIGIAGVAAIFCIIISAINMQVSSGNPEAVSKAQQMITSCITGLILIIFSVLILKIIGVDILRIPSLSK